ncbi:putative polyprenyl synthetase [Purpureocillium lavendulum]|uniref:Polyprenyl synthetase n=1 Tax=Purpureocillium lavendulum TaxID=1247861 RepID=A0AB34FK63_9HYPO|nr:putative polyprenyl synthetase [Purpureocillium lavendulum]
MSPGEMQVLALGLPRTGSASLAEALRILGYKNVHHGLNNIENNSDWLLFDRAADATFSVLPSYSEEVLTRQEWDKAFGSCEAATDVASFFAPQLVQTYPHAKVILTIREFDPWFNSIDKTIIRLLWNPMAEMVVSHDLSTSASNYSITGLGKTPSRIPHRPSGAAAGSMSAPHQPAGHRGTKAGCPDRVQQVDNGFAEHFLDASGKNVPRLMPGAEADGENGGLLSIAEAIRHPALSDPSTTDSEDISFSMTEDEDVPEGNVKIITGPFDYLRAIPGKNVRGQMISAFNAWLDVPSASLDVIADAVNMLHIASLLVDDIEDGSSLRRGVPVAHHIFGTPQTINSANYVYFRALQEVQKLSNPRAVEIFTEELLELHLGQGMDLFWRDTLTCPSEKQYLDMVEKKTGGLFRLAVRLMQGESRKDAVPNCMPLVKTLGVLFQIRDDYQNLTDKAYYDSKGMYEDLTEGKFSFPTIHSIRHDPSNLQLLHILKMKTTDPEVKRYAVKRIESTGSLEYTRQVILDLICQARVMSDELGERNEQVHALLDLLAL